MTLAERITHEREKLGMTYATLAEAVTGAGRPMDKSAIFRIEKGEPLRKVSIFEAVAFAQVFGVTVENLLTPLPLVEHEWAQEVAREWIAATQGLDDAQEALLGAALRLAEVSRRSPDLAEFVGNHWLAASPGRQWWAEFNDELAPEASDAVAVASNDFWEAVLSIIDSKSEALS